MLGGKLVCSCEVALQAAVWCVHSLCAAQERVLSCLLQAHVQAEIALAAGFCSMSCLW